MRSTTITVILLLGLVAPTTVATAQETSVLTVQVFHLQHISAREAAAAIEGHLSREGSMTVRPAARRITVHDHAANVADIDKLISSIDRRPIKFRLRVDVLEGTEAEYSVPALAKVTEQLRKVYPFSSYRRIGVTEFAGEAGDSGTIRLSDEYQIQMTVDEQRLDNLPFGLPESGVRLVVEPFILERTSGKGLPRQLISSRVVMSAGQEVYIAAGSSESSATGLVVIFTAVSVTEH